MLLEDEPAELSSLEDEPLADDLELLELAMELELLELATLPVGLEGAPCSSSVSSRMVPEPKGTSRDASS